MMNENGNQVMTDDGSGRVLLGAPVLVAALGYFVDIYDLLLFGIVRIPSLKDMGVSDADLYTTGSSILNWQMTGLLLGGILWGTLGDKRGRLSVLFGSIITYSLANIACGFVNDPFHYKVIRFIAGIGLAGELGAGITLVSEILPARIRAIGTSIVAGVGLFGAVCAYFMVQVFAWRTAYFIGGGMGFCLLLLRIGVAESGMYQSMAKNETISRGNFLDFFNDASRFKRYLNCILIGIPTWYVIGIIATFVNEFKSNREADLVPGLAIMWCYVGLAIGDLSSGLISHRLQSRKKAVALMLTITLLLALVFLLYPYQSATMSYTLLCLMGWGIGYWAMFVTISAEQFGSNLRSTAATTVPNMVRGTVVLLTTSFGTLKEAMDPSYAGLIVGAICFALAYLALSQLAETHGRDLDFVEPK